MGMKTDEALALIADLRTGVEMDKHHRPDGERMLEAIDHLLALADPDALTTAYMAGAEKARSEMQAEIDRLRADADEWKRRGEAYFQTAEQQGKRAERLAEALRGVMYWDNGKSEWDEARAALEQEAGRG